MITSDCYPKVAGPKHPKLLAPPAYSITSTNSNKILRGDQSRQKENFYGINTAPAPGQIFCDTNADVQSACDS